MQLGHSRIHQSGFQDDFWNLPQRPPRSPFPVWVQVPPHGPAHPGPGPFVGGACGGRAGGPRLFLDQTRPLPGTAQVTVIRMRCFVPGGGWPVSAGGTS